MASGRLAGGLQSPKVNQAVFQAVSQRGLFNLLPPFDKQTRKCGWCESTAEVGSSLVQ